MLKCLLSKELRIVDRKLLWNVEKSFLIVDGSFLLGREKWKVDYFVGFFGLLPAERSGHRSFIQFRIVSSVYVLPPNSSLISSFIIMSAMVIAGSSCHSLSATFRHSVLCL